MKTAISIPDKVYESAEKLAHRLGESRSELYTRAVKSYIEKHRETGVTEKLNEVYDIETPDLDQVLVNLQTHAWVKTVDGKTWSGLVGGATKPYRIKTQLCQTRANNTS